MNDEDKIKYLNDKAKLRINKKIDNLQKQLN